MIALIRFLFSFVTGKKSAVVVGLIVGVWAVNSYYGLKQQNERLLSSYKILNETHQQAIDAYKQVQLELEQYQKQKQELEIKYQELTTLIDSQLKTNQCYTQRLPDEVIKALQKARE